MNAKINALTQVGVQAHSYFDLKDQTEEQRQRLVQSMKEAKKLDATQEKIAEATITQIGDKTHRLSRQRVAQILQEGSDG
jgi:galactose mutarotase-like enzyme